MKYHPKITIGMRNVKTAIAVFLCLIGSRIIGYSYPLYACTAAVLSMRDTVEDSIHYGKTRIKATIVGGIMGIVMLWVDSELFKGSLTEVLITLGIIATIYVCNLLGWSNSSAIACVVVLIVLIDHSADKYVYAVIRTTETIMGIVVAVIVNKTIRPPMSKKSKE